MTDVIKPSLLTDIEAYDDYYTSNYNIALKGNRDIGSTIKPLLYYEAIKCGFINQHFYSSPYTFKYNDELITVKNNSNHYTTSLPNWNLSLRQTEFFAYIYHYK